MRQHGRLMGIHSFWRCVVNMSFCLLRQLLREMLLGNTCTGSELQVLCFVLVSSGIACSPCSAPLRRPEVDKTSLPS